MNPLLKNIDNRDYPLFASRRIDKTNQSMYNLQKSISQLGKYKNEPVLHKTVGGIRGMLERGHQNDISIEFAKQTWADQFALGREYQEPISFKHGYESGHSEGAGVGWTTGVKDYMVNAQKFNIVSKEGPARNYPNQVDAFRDPEVLQYIINMEIGPSFEKSEKYQKVIKSSTKEITQNFKEERKALREKHSYDKSDFIDTYEDYHRNNHELKQKRDNEITNMIKQQKKLYNGELARLSNSDGIQNWISRKEKIGSKTMPFFLTDDFHIYNVPTLRDFHSKKTPLDDIIDKIDRRSNPIIHEDLRDYIGVPKSDRKSMTDMNDDIIVSGKRIFEYQMKEYPDTPIIDQLRKEGGFQGLKQISFDTNFEPFPERDAELLITIHDIPVVEKNVAKKKSAPITIDDIPMKTKLKKPTNEKLDTTFGNWFSKNPVVSKQFRVTYPQDKQSDLITLDDIPMKADLKKPTNEKLERTVGNYLADKLPVSSEQLTQMEKYEREMAAQDKKLEAKARRKAQAKAVDPIMEVAKVGPITINDIPMKAVDPIVEVAKVDSIAEVLDQYAEIKEERKAAKIATPSKPTTSSNPSTPSKIAKPMIIEANLNPVKGVLPVRRAGERERSTQNSGSKTQLSLSKSKTAISAASTSNSDKKPPVTRKPWDRTPSK